MAIASGLTSAITSPLHPEMLQAVKAADVLMGNDPHCATWIARNGDSPTGDGHAWPARWPRRAGARTASVVTAVPTRSSSSPRPGDAAGSTHGTTVLEAARRLGVDLDSVCGGRGICGRCQIEVAEGEHAKHGIDVDGREPVAATEVERALRRRPRPRGRAPPRLHRLCRR